MTHEGARGLHDAVQIRRAGPGLLSLALIDARNRTLRWLACFEAAGVLQIESADALPVLCSVGHAGWFQEYWIARHVQRGRGAAADPDAPRLVSHHPAADAWFQAAPRGTLRTDDAPSVSELRDYLEATLEVTLDLLDGCDASDEALYFYRLALLHEDRLAETWASAAHRCAVDPAAAAELFGSPPARAQREALWFPATRFEVGSPPGGLVPANERWAFEVEVPEFEVDAQPVSWQRYVEFAEDGGYDREELWSPEGWGLVQQQGRRAPRGVEQLRGGVLLRHCGVMQRAPLGQAAHHLTWHEADAWCRWAGRRLPTEPEWELAACTAAARGFVWGDVWEWVAGRARPWPGADATPPVGFSRVPPEPGMRVLRGASSWSARRCVHPKSRRFVGPERDDLCCGFRSCAA